MPNKAKLSIEDLRKLILTALEDLKAVDVVELDVKGKTSVTDLLIIASGTSSRHVKSIASNVAVEVKKQGSKALGVEGEDQGEWVLVDLGDIVVHVMQPHVRQFYDLEKLWSFNDSDETSAESN
ncbi:MAG: ribosome silencing factor [endosymbiont of Galathealinum brachiosum]|uniref:Ribosomal silencing factor RsfS n=1 Tax=endosymbiont of Galathealinum brachiosum TaxID=2200906 RepID=A0A370DJ61_9GAMM|nr:MAG: ribosome silencing factor [endosymbiont of Galathealinum brachiosum]